MIKTIVISVASMTLTGCAPMIAGALAVSTPDEIKRSEYTVQLTSDRPLESVTGCMKNALLSYRDEAGRNSYSAITYRDSTPPHQIVLSNNLPSTWSGLRPELRFFLENNNSVSGGTTTQIWAHQRLLGNGGSKAYLDRVVSTVRPCLAAGAQASAAMRPGVSSNPAPIDESIKKLEQLKNLADRGIISKEDFEQKKKAILEGF